MRALPDKIKAAVRRRVQIARVRLGQTSELPSEVAPYETRDIMLHKEVVKTKIGCTFSRDDLGLDNTPFNVVDAGAVQPIVKKVDSGSVAEIAGLVPGDIVTSINGVAGLSNFQVVEILQKGRGRFDLVVVKGRTRMA